MERVLKRVYYSRDSPACFSGLERVFKEAHRRRNDITRADVREYLQKQRTYTLYHPAVRKFKKLRTVPDGLNTDWQADLAQLDKLKEHNDDYAYILVCIEVLSRRIYAEPVKQKTAACLIPAFDRIFHRAGTRPWKLFTDCGKEFVSAEMKRYFRESNVLKFEAKTNKVQHAAMAERANRTLKDRLYKYFSEQNTLRWIDVLQSFVDAINRSECRSTGMRPIDVTQANARDLMDRLYPRTERTTRKAKFEEGDCVRVEKVRKLIQQKGLSTFTDQIFTVAEVLDHKDPVVYRLKDYFERPLEGYFYERELVKVPPWLENTARVERVLQERERNGVREFLVRWLDHPHEYDSWVAEADYDVTNNVD